MQKYAKRTRLAAWSDRAAGRAAVLALGVGWFVWLWGLSAAALCAGLAFGALLTLCVERLARRTVQKRERQMRRRIGGEIALDALLEMEPRKAAFQAAVWLGERAEMRRTTETGVICRIEGRETLVLALATHPSAAVGAQALIEARREGAKQQAEAVALCLTAPVGREAEIYAESGAPPLRLVKRDELLALAGACAPATDEQLRAMGQRPRAGLKKWLVLILDRRRAKRYFLYGAGLAALYLITGLPYYPFPAVLCLLLCLASRFYRPRKKRGFFD